MKKLSIHATTVNKKQQRKRILHYSGAGANSGQVTISISIYYQILNSVSTFDVKTKKLIFHHLNICPPSGKQSTLFQFVCHLIVRGTTIEDIKSSECHCYLVHQLLLAIYASALF